MALGVEMADADHVSLQYDLIAQTCRSGSLSGSIGDCQRFARRCWMIRWFNQCVALVGADALGFHNIAGGLAEFAHSLIRARTSKRCIRQTLRNKTDRQPELPRVCFPFDWRESGDNSGARANVIWGRWAGGRIKGFVPFGHF